MSINVGSKVRFKGAFLKSIGAYTGTLGQAKGTVTSLKELGSLRIAQIKWEDGEESGANVSNLIECGKPDYSNM